MSIAKGSERERPMSKTYLSWIRDAIEHLKNKGQRPTFLHIMQLFKESPKTARQYNYDVAKKQIELAVEKAHFFALGSNRHRHFSEVLFDVEELKINREFSVSSKQDLTRAVLDSVQEIIEMEPAGPSQDDIYRFIKLTYMVPFSDKDLNSNVQKVMHVLTCSGALVFSNQRYKLGQSAVGDRERWEPSSSKKAPGEKTSRSFLDTSESDKSFSEEQPQAKKREKHTSEKSHILKKQQNRDSVAKCSLPSRESIEKNDGLDGMGLYDGEDEEQLKQEEDLLTKKIIFSKCTTDAKFGYRRKVECPYCKTLILPGHLPRHVEAHERLHKEFGKVPKGCFKLEGSPKKKREYPTDSEVLQQTSRKSAKEGFLLRSRETSLDSDDWFDDFHSSTNKKSRHVKKVVRGTKRHRQHSHSDSSDEGNRSDNTTISSTEPKKKRQPLGMQRSESPEIEVPTAEARKRTAVGSKPEKSRRQSGTDSFST